MKRPKLIKINDFTQHFDACYNIITNEIHLNEAFCKEWKKYGINKYNLIRHELVHWTQVKKGALHKSVGPMQIFLLEMQAYITMLKNKSLFYKSLFLPTAIFGSLCSTHSAQQQRYSFKQNFS